MKDPGKCLDLYAVPRVTPIRLDDRLHVMIAFQNAIQGNHKEVPRPRPGRVRVDPGEYVYPCVFRAVRKYKADPEFGIAKRIFFMVSDFEETAIDRYESSC